MPPIATALTSQVCQDQEQQGQNTCLGSAFQTAAKSIAIVDAIQRWDLDSLLDLLRGGADLHQAGLAALKMAAGENDQDVVSELLQMLEQAGVDVNTPDPHGDTALTVAAREGHHDVVSLLSQSVLRAGGDLNAPNKYGFTPLQEAAYKGHQKAAEVLIEGLLRSGGDLNAANEYGFTALTRAAYMARWEVVALLANALQQSGGDVNVSTPGYGTALTLAGEHQNLRAMNQLLLAGAAATDDDLQTISHLLGSDDAEINHADLVERANDMGLKGVADALQVTAQSNG